MDFDIFVSKDGETGTFWEDFDNEQHARQAFRFLVSNNMLGFRRITLYHFDTVIENWSTR